MGSIDRLDLICLVGLALFGLGLGLWFGAGPALTIVGALLLTFGIGSRLILPPPAPAAGDQPAGDQPAGGAGPQRAPLGQVAA